LWHKFNIYNTPHVEKSSDDIYNFTLTSSYLIGAASCKRFLEIMKMEFMASHILGLLKRSSTFAKDCRLKLMPNGVGFLVF
jgi:hypothetical protein